MAENDRLAVLTLDQLGRNGSLEGPNRVCVLRGQSGVEFQRQRSSRINTRVHVARHTRVVGGVSLRLSLTHFHGNLRRELIKTLMGPDSSARTAFDRSGKT